MIRIYDTIGDLAYEVDTPSLGKALELLHRKEYDISKLNLDGDSYGYEFANFNLSNANLKVSVFKNFNMINCHLENANLSRSVFKNLDIINCNFKNTNLQNALFKDCNIENSSFADSNLKNVVFEDCNIENCGNIEELNDEYSNENFIMSDSLAKRLVDSIKTDYDKNKSPLKKGDFVIDENSNGFKFEIGRWNGSATNMEKDNHAIIYRQMGSSTHTNHILKLDEEKQKIIKDFYNEVRENFKTEVIILNGHSNCWTVGNFKILLINNKLYFDPIVNQFEDCSKLSITLRPLLKKYGITIYSPLTINKNNKKENDVQIMNDLHEFCKDHYSRVYPIMKYKYKHEFTIDPFYEVTYDKETKEIKITDKGLDISENIDTVTDITSFINRQFGKYDALDFDGSAVKFNKKEYIHRRDDNNIITGKYYDKNDKKWYELSWYIDSGLNLAGYNSRDVEPRDIEEFLTNN